MKKFLCGGIKKAAKLTLHVHISIDEEKKESRNGGVARINFSFLENSSPKHLTRLD